MARTTFPHSSRTILYRYRGAAVLELALVIVLLLLLVLTFTELGIAIRRSNVIAEAARAGARAAAAKSSQDSVNYCTSPMIGINALCGTSPIPASDAALSGFRAACNYLQSEGADLSAWRVRVDLETRIEDSFNFPFIRLNVEQADPDKKNCVICFAGFMDDFKIASAAVFAVQRNCT